MKVFCQMSGKRFFGRVLCRHSPRRRALRWRRYATGGGKVRTYHPACQNASWGILERKTPPERG